MRGRAHSLRAASQAVFTQSLPRSCNENTPYALAIAWCRLLAGGFDLFLDSGFGPEPVLALAVAFDLPGPRTIRACRMYERYRPVFAPYRSPVRSLRARAMQMLPDSSWKQRLPILRRLPAAARKTAHPSDSDLRAKRSRPAPLPTLQMFPGTRAPLAAHHVLRDSPHDEFCAATR